MTPFTMKNLICVALVLSIALLGQQGNGAFGLYVKRQELAPAATPAAAPTTTLLNKEISFLEPLNDDERLTDDLHFYRSKQPNFLVIWPGLRDLLLMPADYDELETNAYNSNINNNVGETINEAANEELFNLRFMNKLQLLSQNAGMNELEEKRENEPSMPEIVPTGVKFNNKNGPFIDEPVDLHLMEFKHHGIKKNAQWPIENAIVRKAVRKQYMSPCHFKICNMGRKRHARY